MSKLRLDCPFNTRFMVKGEKPGIIIHGESMTVQEFKNETDINYIMEMYKVRGIIPPLSPNPPAFEDLTGTASSYMQAMETVLDAKARFDALPSVVRKEVGNTPLGMLEWLQDPKNTKRGVELGLLVENVPPAAVPPVVVPRPDTPTVIPNSSLPSVPPVGKDTVPSV